MGKRKSSKYLPEGVQPYKNMRARKTVLILGFAVTLIAAILVIVGYLMLFVPEVNAIKTMPPTKLNTIILSIGVALSFIGTVFSVAGANTKKSLARFTFFLSVNAFILCSALLIVITLFRTILPLDAIRRLAGCVTTIPITTI